MVSIRLLNDENNDNDVMEENNDDVKVKEFFYTIFPFKLVAKKRKQDMEGRNYFFPFIPFKVIIKNRNNENDDVAKGKEIIVPFKVLIKKRQFKKIEEIFNKYETKIIIKWLGLGYNQRQLLIGSGYSHLDTPLHYCLTVKPPLQVVEYILKMCQSKNNYYNKRRSSSNNNDWVPEDAIDMFGRTPLHIAVIHECTSDVIRRLIQNGSTAPLIQDTSLRLPLHWATVYDQKGFDDIFDDSITTSNTKLLLCNITTGCFTNGGKKKKKKQQKDIDNMFDICQILIDAYPEAVLVKDIYGLTPLQLASDPRIKALLKFTAKQVDGRKKKQDRSNVLYHNNNNKSNNKKIITTTTFEQEEEDVDERSCTNITATETSNSWPSGVPGEISIVSSNISTKYINVPTTKKKRRHRNPYKYVQITV